MKHTHFQKVLAGTLAAAMVFSMTPLSACAATKTTAAKNSAPTTFTHAVAHDPSIVKDASSKNYYILGSHTAAAKSNNLMNWTQLSTDYQTPSQEPFFGNLQTTLKESFRWAGYNDGDAANGNYAVWGPDVIYNPQYAWSDGSKGAYMLYYCTSSTWRRSCIGYLVSKTIDGTYQYRNTIVYSGFTKTGEPDGNSTRNTKWDNDYLNLKSLIAKGAKNGGIDSITDDKCFQSDGSWNNQYAPNAIDPTVFFDKSGKQMYMVYGSWSGGLYMLKMNPETGEPLYPGKDGTDKVSGNYVDRYFGIHIAGGNHQSGEGPFILYDKASDYYYLYESYGGLAATGGYNMRLFRSKNPTGPYVDAVGNNAADNGTDNAKYGIKVMGNYKFYNQTGKRSSGGNSALLDDDGSMYLVYHQRFDSNPSSEAHEVRIHQQFLNEDNWPVTAVYEYRKETITTYPDKDVIGTYEFVNHGTAAADGNMLTTQLVRLNQDGSVSGDVTGTWKKAASSAGYDYITLKLGNVTYKGVFFKQYDEENTPKQKMTFTAIGGNNTTVWGSMVDTSSDQTIANMAAESLAKQVPTSAVDSISLPTSVMGASISWSSSNTKVLRASGAVTPPTKDTSVILTAAVSYKTAKVTQKFTVKVQHTASLIYDFDFNKNPDSDRTLHPANGSAKSGKAILQGTASLVTDAQKGRVLKLTNTAKAQGVNYLKLPKDTFSTVTSAGYSVSMWVKASSDTFEHSALFEADAVGTSSNGYPMTRIGVNLIGRINANAYSDVQGSLLKSNGFRNQWEKVVYTVGPSGIKVYLNGALVGEEKKDLSTCFANDNGSIQKATQVAVGSGPIWGDEDVRNAEFDNVQIYDGILREKEIAHAYKQDIGAANSTLSTNKQSKELKDTETGISVHGEQKDFPENMKLYAQMLSTENPEGNAAVKHLPKTVQKNAACVYSIGLTQNGKEITPAQKVSLLIPLANTLSADKLAVFQMQADGSSKLVTGVEVKDRTVTFEAASLGVFVLAQTGDTNVPLPSVAMNNHTTQQPAPSDTLEIPAFGTITLNFASSLTLKDFAFNTGNGKALQTDTSKKWGKNQGQYFLYAGGKIGETTGVYVNGKRLFKVKIVDRPFRVDTTKDIRLAEGQSYIFSISPKVKTNSFSFVSANGKAIETSIVAARYPDASGRYDCQITVKSPFKGKVGIYCSLNGSTYKVFAVSSK